MSRCTNCGQQASRRARFCARCGDGLTGPGGAPPTATPPWVPVGVALAIGALSLFGAAGALDGRAPAGTVTLAGEVRLDDPGTRIVGSGGGGVRPEPETGCVTPAGITCAVPFDTQRRVVAVGRVGDDVILLDTERRLRRVTLPHAGPGTPGDLRVHWEQTLDGAVPIEPHDDPGITRSGGPLLTVDDRLVLIADARGVSAVATDDGTPRWRVGLPGDSTGPSYRAWRIGDDVLAANRFHLAAIDGDSGEVSWSVERPSGDVQPIDGGVAIVARDVVRGFVPAVDEAVWQMRRATPNRGAFGVVDRPAGPVVIDGRASVTLHPDDGRVLIEHGTDSVLTRAGDGTVVAAEWDTAAVPPTLVGYEPDGTMRWRTTGPDVRCCELLLRPTQDGRVLAATIGRGRTEVGWLIDPADGRITASVRRPAITSSLPLAVGDGTSVWLDGGALVGAALDSGEVRWRAPAGTVLLSESPLLLRTREGLVRP